VLPEPDAASIPFAAMEPIYVAAGSRVSMPVDAAIPAAIPVQCERRREHHQERAV
jgi:hypothetical protein